MSLLGGWILFPLVLGLVCSGIGLLAERVAGLRLPGALVPPVGMAVLIAVAGLPTIFDATAELAVPLIAALAALGLIGCEVWKDERLRAPWHWPLLAAVGAYVVFAAPSLLSGQGSIAGYVKLDDSAIWILHADHLLEHGRSLDGIAPSSVQATLDAWMGSGYPVGAFLPFGIGGRLSGQDLAGVYQPAIAFAAAMLALGFHATVGPLVRSRALGAAVAVIAVQASLFLGYAQWGGIKEPVTAAVLVLVALLALRASSARSFGLLAVTAGALIGMLGLNGLAWAGPALLLGAVLTLRRQPGAWKWTPVLAVLLVAAIAPALATLDFTRQITAGAISAQEDFGNLGRALSVLQGFGLWPAGDFRVDPEPRFLAVLLALTGVVAAAWAVAESIRARAYEVPAVIGLTLIGTVPALVVGSPWVDAKALAVLSPMVLLGTAALVALALQRPQEPVRAAGAAAATLLVLATAWSTWSVVRDVYIAPRERLAELRDLRPLVRGAGPTIVLDFEIYAQRYFLAEADPEGATDLRMRPVLRRDGQQFERLSTAEVDELAVPDLWVYRTIVRRRSPSASRPPSAFNRIHAGDGFEVWQRSPDAPAPLARLPLGDAVNPTGTVGCAEIEALARTPGIRQLAAVPRRPPVVVDLRTAPVPPTWLSVAGDVRPGTDGVADIPVDVASGGAWRVWIGGTVFGRLAAQLDGRPVGSLRHELSHTGQWLRYGAAPVEAGRRTVRLDFARGGLLRGGRQRPFDQSPLGPLVLTPPEDEAELPVRTVDPREHRQLCDGATYDWIEALG